MNVRGRIALYREMVPLIPLLRSQDEDVSVATLSRWAWVVKEPLDDGDLCSVAAALSFAMETGDIENATSILAGAAPSLEGPPSAFWFDATKWCIVAASSTIASVLVGASIFYESAAIFAVAALVAAINGVVFSAMD